MANLRLELPRPAVSAAAAERGSTPTPPELPPMRQKHYPKLEWACLVPLGVSALTLVSFGGVAAARAIFRASQPVITPLLGQFFAAFCGASVLGCCLVCLCTHHAVRRKVHTQVL